MRLWFVMWLWSLWSDRTFGRNRGPKGILAHLEKEIGELRQNPYDLGEYVDCLALLLDAARCAGYDVAVLRKGLRHKLRVNEARSWGAPDVLGVVEHSKHGGMEAAEQGIKVMARVGCTPREMFDSATAMYAEIPRPVVKALIYLNTGGKV